MRLIRSALEPVFGYERADIYTEELHKFPSWTSIRSLGQSKILRLTILVPFIGWIILFNGKVVDFISLSSHMLDRTSHSGGNPDDLALGFTLSKLQITYFGLSFVGIASALFNILCPQDIKKFEDAQSYIDSTKGFMTNATRNRLVVNVANDYLTNHGDLEARGSTYLRNAAYHLEQRILFYSVFEEITESIEFTDDVEAADRPTEYENSPDASEIHDVEIDHDPFGIRVGPRSAVDPERVARIIAAQRNIERAFWTHFQLEAANFLVDFMMLRYAAINNSRPLARLVISAMYAIGFALLFIPTLTTFWLIVRRVFTS